MTGFLLDTNCISEVVQPKPNPQVVRWMDVAPEDQMYLSVLTVGEIRKGADLLPAGVKRTALERWLEAELPARFKSRILDVTAPVADRWGALAAAARKKGLTLAVVDGLIAATALHHALTVVTRNVKDFADLGVNILNPWDAPP
jgi:toxin FitB